ncbi:MAG TPA: phage portal protein, partial [Porticoccus sp.]|nr:phage portal protein [Porticoccus sp.]
YNSEGLPTLLEFLNPLNVRVNTDSKQNIIDYRLNREQEDLTLNEVIYISGFDLLNSGDSVSKLENALPYTSLERGIITHATSFFFNGATITGVVSIKKTGMNDDLFNKFKKEFKRNFSGADKGFKTAIFDMEVEYTPISAAPADLAMVELSDQSKQFVCAAFGVNPALVGLGDVSDPLSALSTYQETRRSFVDMEATPTLDFILDNFNTQWALTDFPIPIHLVSDSSAMAMMNDGISTDDMGVATSALAGDVLDRIEAREHVGYGPDEHDDGYPIRAPGWTGTLYNDGTITMNQRLKMLHIEPLLIEDFRKVDGITYKVADLPLVAEKNLEKLAAPAPSPFGLSIMPPPAPPTTPMLSEGSPLAELDVRTSDVIPDDAMLIIPRDENGYWDKNNVVMVQGIARQITPRLIIGIDLADHQLVNLAQRELGRALAEQTGITWVAPQHWRVELAHIDRWSPADISNMTRVIKWDFNKTEVLTGGYFINGNGVYLSLGDTEATDEIRRLVHSDLRSVAIKSNEVVPAMAIRLAHGAGITQEMLPQETALGSMPIVFTRIAAFANDKIQHKWRLRAYLDKDNQALLGKQRDELSKWQQRVVRSGVGAEWAIDCLPAHVVRFVKDDALEELRLLLKFIEEEHPRDPDGKFTGDGDGGKDGDGGDADKDEKQEKGRPPDKVVIIETQQIALDIVNNPANYDENGVLDPDHQFEVDDYSLFITESKKKAIQDALAETSEIAINQERPEAPVADISGPVNNGVQSSTITDIRLEGNFGKVQEALGETYTPEQVVALTGMGELPKGAENQGVSIQPLKDGSVSIGTTRGRDNVIATDYVLFRDGDGNLVGRTKGFFLKEELQGQGIGTRMLNDQMENLRAGGFDRMELRAERGENMNGYYTWARLGYDADLRFNRIPILPANLQSATRVSDLMKTKEGRDWWKENGVSTEMSFDLDENSQSSRVLAAYIEARKNR